MRAVNAQFAQANETSDQFHRRAHEVGTWTAWVEMGRELRAARDAFMDIGRNPILTPQSRASAIMNAANCLMDVGRVFDALDVYEEADRLRPNDGMVRGNRGITLVKVSGLLPAHRLLVGRAIEDLTFAISAEHVDPGHDGHPHSRDTFAWWLERVSHHRQEDLPKPEVREYEDPYVAWVHAQNLLLSPALGSMPPEDDLDASHINGLVTSIADFAPQGFAIPPAFSAVNAIKRDYLTSRLLAYFATERPPELRLASRSRSAHYVDTLDYARWDLKSGLAAGSYAMAINLADKIATFLAMWIELPTDHVNDRNWAFDRPPRARRGEQASAAPRCGPVKQSLATYLKANAERSIGLLGLVDLAQEEFESPTRQAKRNLRDAATHRFLSVRLFGIGNQESALVDAIEQDDLHRDMLIVLRQVRRMFLQASLAVRQKGLIESEGALAPAMPLMEYIDPMIEDQP